MSAVVAEATVLSDSTQRTRPDFSSYIQLLKKNYKVDANAGGNCVQQIEQRRLERQMKFPSIVGRHDVESFQKLQDMKSPAYKKYNDEGDHRPDGPNRFPDSFVDPVSGFMSASGDVDRNTGHTHIPSMVPLNNTPQSYNPHRINTIRLHDSAPPDIRRQTDRDPGSPYVWGGRKVLDSSLRASLGGWTSEQDPRILEEQRLRGDEAKKPIDKSKELRDVLANKFMYTSSTQKAYEEVPWDNMLRSRRWAPTTTLEPRPDQVSQVFTNKRYPPRAQEYQNVGRSWDWFQTRKTNYKKNIPIPGTVFISSSARTGQIPFYGGCVGGENILEVDNPDESFEPFTVKRSLVPRPTDTAHRPNIPKYEGCTLYRYDRLAQPMHGNSVVPEPQTTLRVHRSMPIFPNTSEFRKRSYMSKMVTTVPPSNPFNKINKEVVQITGEEPRDFGNSPTHQQAIAVKA